MTGALSLLAGVLLGLLSAGVPGAGWQAAVAVLLAAWLVSAWRHEVLCRCMAMLLAGLLLSSLHARHWLDRALPREGRWLAEGRIASIPERDGGALRFELRTERLEGVSDPERPRLVRVQWRDPHAAPRVGERWRLLLRAVPLEDTRNFSGIDTARFAFRAGVHGAGRVLPSNLNELQALAPAGLDTLRARIASRVRDAVADPDAAGLISALAVGITQGMSREQWRVFNVTGTTHLVAISGLHVTLFAWLAFRAARFAWGFTRGRVMSREAFALSSGLLAAGGYSLLAGLSVPTLRTWLMLALYVVARLMARQIDAGRLWSTALVIVLLIDPRAPLAAGFWLSFIAVGVLLAFTDGARASGATARLRSAVQVQLTVMLALIPASLAIFGGVSLVGLAVNLVAIPVISLVLVPVVLAGALAAWLAPALATPFFGLAAWLHEWLWPGLAWCADVEAVPALWRTMAPGWWFVLALPAALVWLCPWPRTLRLGAICALLPLVFARADGPGAGVAWISVLDAGRGSAALIRTRGHTLLFDTGDSWNTRGARFAGIALPALDAARIRRVDRLLLPSLDDDRARATALLAVDRGLGDVWVSASWPGNGHAARCRDATWQWDGVGFDVHVSGPHCVLRASVRDRAIWFMGDLDAEGERALLSRLPADVLAGDVVLIGRQTGEGASSAQWIENTAPGLAIATGGIEGAQSRGRVMERWRSRGSRLIDTREEGAVELRLSAQGVSVHAVASESRFPFHWRRSARDPG